jgi:hypothetical protein
VVVTGFIVTAYEAKKEGFFERSCNTVVVTGFIVTDGFSRFSVCFKPFQAFLHHPFSILLGLPVPL